MTKSLVQTRPGRIVSAFGVCALLLACSGGGGGSDGPSTLAPASVNVPVGGRTQFTLSPAQGATWSVDGDVGGNDTVGHISFIGGYTAPFVIPSASTALPSGNPVLATVTVGASVATNTSTVSIVRRFVHEGPVDICVSASCGPVAIIAPDLNGDSFADFVTANSLNGTISVVLRNGSTGVFGSPDEQQVSATAEPQALVSGLFDGNQTTDLVIADADHDLSSTPAVRSWLGQGNGTFPTRSSVGLPSASSPLSIGAGFFNNDNYLDVVVADFSRDTLVILLNSSGGSGVLSTPIDLPLSVGSSPLGVAVADFNGDLFDDIAVANNGSGTVSVFLAIGDPLGGFGAAQTYNVDGGPSAIVATDLNLDGFPDLAVTTSSGRLVLILNKGVRADATTFNLPGTPYSAGAEPVAVAAGDVNQDQMNDLVVVNRLDKTLVVYLGHGDGTVTVSETYAVGAAPQAVAVGDFNKDSFPDLAVANSGDDTVTILRNRGR